MAHCFDCSAVTNLDTSTAQHVDHQQHRGHQLLRGSGSSTTTTVAMRNVMSMNPEVSNQAAAIIRRKSRQDSVESTGSDTNTSSSSSSSTSMASATSSSSSTSATASSSDVDQTACCSAAISLGLHVLPPSLINGLIVNSPSKLLTTQLVQVPVGPRFKLIQDGDLQVCRLNHTRTVISKILSSKFLRRWESHRLCLADTVITSKTPYGFMEDPISYSYIEDVYVVSRWDAGQKFCLRIVIPDGSVLMQVNNAYLRDQWLHSIQWKRSVYKYKKLLRNTRRPEVLIKELKNMVELSVTTPLQDECIHHIPLQMVSELLSKETEWMPTSSTEEIIVALVPLFENNHPSPEICDFFSKHCKDNPRSSLVMELFTPIVQRILKHNVDFGKYPRMRVFVQEYILALSCQNDGLAVTANFIHSMHGPSSLCPHPRVLPNLVSVCVAAVYSIFEERRSITLEEMNDSNRQEADWETALLCFVAALQTMSTFNDWRPGLAQLLQPIPFPDESLSNGKFSTNFMPVIYNIGMDSRCDVHLMVLGIREGKEGWLHVYCPGNIACTDEGELWTRLLKTLLGCCCRRKRFLQTLNKMLGPCMLLALRGDGTCQDALCAMLELDVVQNDDHKLQMVTTLQSTTEGKQRYAAVCDRQMHLRELQQKGGPKKLTLPSRSTDADVAKLLSCGSFGNLECLSLAFTQVTSACADQLIKLPSLRYLNLWSTQFGDAGLQLLSEHLHKLQVLNLCETPVTDKGLVSLSSMKNLRKLNLNSTSLSAHTFEGLKQRLPALQECDVRYTDAW